MTPARLDWTPPPFPPAKVLEGNWCRLEPLDPDRHLDDIWAANAGHDAVWDWLPTTPPASREAYRELLASMAANSAIVPLAVIDKADGRAKGHLWIMEIRPAQGVFEVGWITYSPSLQRTRTATEAIYLVGEYGFSLGYRRYEWKCNDLNGPSKRAALRFGFTYEGLFRQHMVVKGANRDTAWYSILDGEWPQRALAFRQWLAPENFDAEGRQRVSLAALNRHEATSGAVSLRRASLRDLDAIAALTDAAYLPNEATIKVPSLPRIADHAAVLREHEVWVAGGETIAGVIVFERTPGRFTLWSVAVAPEAAGQGLGGALLAFAEARATELGHDHVHLYTHALLAERIGWYERRGYLTTHEEELPDRRLVHMRKDI